MISPYQSVYLNRFGKDWEDSHTHILMCTQTYRIYERVYVCVCVCVCVCVQEAHRLGNMIGISVPERHSVHVKGGYACIDFCECVGMQVLCMTYTPTDVKKRTSGRVSNPSDEFQPNYTQLSKLNQSQGDHVMRWVNVLSKP